MPNDPSSLKYYRSAQAVWKQLPTIWPMLLFSIVGFIYSSGLQNPTVRAIGFYGSFGLLALMFLFIIIDLLTLIRKFNYAWLDSDGVHTTTLGFIHTHVYWSDIERIGKTRIGNVEGIGMMYKPSVDRYVWGRKTRRKLFGWDETIGGAYRLDGASLADDVAKQFNEYSRIGR